MTTTNTIETTEDLLRIVRENAEFRAAMRRELLTDELLALPGQFAAMLEEQAEFRRVQNIILEEIRMMRGDIRELHGMYRRQHEDMGRFRGNYAFSTMRRDQYDIARPFARMRGIRRTSVRPLPRAELNRILQERYDALDALGLRDRAWETFQNPDLIAEVTGIRNSDTGFYIAVEASYTGGLEDALRATEHAKMLRQATGKDSYAVVAAVRLGPSLRISLFNDVTRFVEARDEDAVLWYQLDEEKLEPLDPC